MIEAMLNFWRRRRAHILWRQARKLFCAARRKEDLAIRTERKITDLAPGECFGGEVFDEK